MELIQGVLGEQRKFPILHGVDSHYPKMDSWLQSLKQGSETPIITVTRNDNLVGLCIGKNTEEEKKLRCVRVHPDFQNSGIGLKMIDSMLDILEVDNPYCTVPQEMFHQFSRAFINRYGFSLDKVSKGMYRRGKLEYLFNEENKEKKGDS